MDKEKLIEIKLQKIRNRASYKFWKEQLKDFKQIAKPGREADALSRLWFVVDAKKGFGYEKNAYYSLESLRQILKDNELKTTNKVFRML